MSFRRVYINGFDSAGDKVSVKALQGLGMLGVSVEL